ncbi:MAG: MmcQ/YjbR family DNA-binding protein [Bacteroidota bacterium]|nr:MmcQ/YjbR family DNA-binding protein [Bacteroidota bacterium]
MNLEELINYCSQKPAVSQEFPFGEETLVFKVSGKIFALTGLNNETLEVNLKCAPEKAIEWREKHDEIRPGYHMNKKHWNTVNFEGHLSSKFLKELIDHSYEMVWNQLPKKLRV